MSILIGRYLENLARVGYFSVVHGQRDAGRYGRGASYTLSDLGRRLVN